MDLQEELIRHGAAIERLMNEEAVKTTFQQLNAWYFEHWKAAEVPEHREIIWNEMRALGSLIKHFETAVATGQGELERRKAAENPISRD